MDVTNADHARTDIVEVAALLVAARTILVDPARWCAWPQALDRDGTPCQGRANRAVRWGALGALDCAAFDAKATHRSIAEATALLNQASVTVPNRSLATTHVLDLNPSHTMALWIFDQALNEMPKPDAPTASDILVIARSVIARPNRWAQGAIALDCFGRALISFDGGCRFCAAGAVGLAAHVLGADEAARRCMGATLDRVSELLDCAAFKIGEYESYIGLNEHDTHARVLAMFDHALDMAHAETAREPRES